ncbi:YncE family protein [Chrysiogenes arsenatis]|uniref:YncE family protein n=1 Tax=Chrysiogenes arsenatis TaxID=309797 RepID=UPI0004011D7A|nr:YncE family protein [Chrysiogenes arsenatis]
MHVFFVNRSWALVALLLLLVLSGCERKEVVRSDAGLTALTPVNVVPITAVERLYVTAMNEDKVVAIDLARGTVVSEQRVGSKPYGLAVDRPRNQLLVVCALGHEVWFLDLDSFAVLGTAKVGRVPGMVTVDESKAHAYVSNTKGDAFSILDVVARQEIAQIETGKAPYNVEILSNNRLAVLNHDAATLTLVDLDAHIVIETYEAVPKSAGLALHPNGTILYSGGHGSQDDATEILVHDLVQGKNIGKIHTGDMPASMSISNNALHVVLHDSERLVSYALTEGYPEISRLTTGKYPFAVIPILSNENRVAVTNMDSDLVQVFDIAAGKEVQSIPVVGGPVGAVYYIKQSGSRE